MYCINDVIYVDAKRIKGTPLRQLKAKTWSSEGNGGKEKGPKNVEHDETGKGLAEKIARDEGQIIMIDKGKGTTSSHTKAPNRFPTQAPRQIPTRALIQLHTQDPIQIPSLAPIQIPISNDSP